MCVCVYIYICACVSVGVNVCECMCVRVNVCEYVYVVCVYICKKEGVGENVLSDTHQRNGKKKKKLSQEANISFNSNTFEEQNRTKYSTVRSAVSGYIFKQ